MTEAQEAAVRTMIQLLQDYRDVLAEERDRLIVEWEQFPSLHPPVGEGPEDGNYPKWIFTVAGNEETAKLYNDLDHRRRESEITIYKVKEAVRILEALLSKSERLNPIPLSRQL